MVCMNALRAKELNQKLESDQDVLVVNVLGDEAFAKEHIPGSHHVDNERDDFVAEVTNLAGRKDRPIVVYCASKDCPASPTAAKKLDEAGFANVYDFEGGMAEWKLAGFDVEQGVLEEARR